MLRGLGVLAVFLAVMQAEARGDGPLKVGVFAVDASPPIGSPMAYDPTKGVVHPLSCRGVVLIGDGRADRALRGGLDRDRQRRPGRSSARRWPRRPARPASRVCVHTLHQHDAPHCDFSADRLLAAQRINREVFDADFARDVIARAAAGGPRRPSPTARPVTHLGLGEAEVEKVASNRRILGPDGKVKYVRYTACADPKIRDQPVGHDRPAAQDDQLLGRRHGRSWP